MRGTLPDRFAMDEFFKTALPVRDSLVLDDTSLALPVGPKARSATTVNSHDRSQRVQQQVQLTLARKSRKTNGTNGSAHLLNYTTKSFDASDGHLTNRKVNRSMSGISVTYNTLPNKHVRRPSRRVEVSPPPTPRFNFNSLRYATYSHPKGHSLGSDSFTRFSTTEQAPPRTMMRPHASMSALGTFGHRSHRQQPSLPPQPVFADAAFQQNGEYGSRRSHHNQSIVRQEQHTVQAQNGNITFGDNQPDEGLSWLAQVRRATQGSRRLNSYPPSVTSVEVDLGRQVDVNFPTQQTHDVSTLRSEIKLPEMTIERAVHMLSQHNEDTIISAASYIQSECLKRADAKKMVYYVRGIGKLLQLLSDDSEEVQRAAAGALRNVVYQSSENKMEVKENDGLAIILHALKSSRDVETRRELTGLLWNLSSHDILKERFTGDALSVLTKSVLVPTSGISEGDNPKDELLADADAFHNATGCLRNLSSAGPDCRKAMRDCENLIDSLVYYVRGAIADYKTDDMPTENCVCILHNLSYQIEAELPKKHSSRDMGESPTQDLAARPKNVGCFSSRSANITEHLERQFPLLEENANPRGVEWLSSAITVRMYLSLMARSVRHHTQEAATGALQNITSGKGAVSEALSYTIVQRENGLQQVKKMLEEGESDTKRTAISLIKNMSRYHELHPDIVKQVLPDVVRMLPDDDTATELPTEVTASLCQILNDLSQSDTQNVKAIVNQGALPNIINISSKDLGYGPTRAGQAACALLHLMWKHSDLHGLYKKFGYRKTHFINARTTKAVNSG